MRLSTVRPGTVVLLCLTLLLGAGLVMSWIGASTIEEDWNLKMKGFLTSTPWLAIQALAVAILVVLLLRPQLLNALWGHEDPEVLRDSLTRAEASLDRARERSARLLAKGEEGNRRIVHLSKSLQQMEADRDGWKGNCERLYQPEVERLRAALAERTREVEALRTALASRLQIAKTRLRDWSDVFELCTNLRDEAFELTEDLEARLEECAHDVHELGGAHWANVFRRLWAPVRDESSPTAGGIITRAALDDVVEWLRTSAASLSEGELAPGWLGDLPGKPPGVEDSPC